jgi:hypothetical protein
MVLVSLGGVVVNGRFRVGARRTSNHRLAFHWSGLRGRHRVHLPASEHLTHLISVVRSGIPSMFRQIQTEARGIAIYI